MQAKLPPLLVLLLTGLLSACGKLDSPEPGEYRAYVKVGGGEIPFMLQVSESSDGARLGVEREGELRPLTVVRMQNGALQAELPDNGGTLVADIGHRALKGELRLTDPHGKPQVLPFAADLHETYRFVAHPGTDNADISGYWELEAISPEHFSAPVTMQLNQRFDGVDGELILPSGKHLALLGQVSNNDVYLSGLGYGRALLLKGKVGKHGELLGDLWTNLSKAQRWAAKRLPEEDAAAQAQPEEQEQMRYVAFPSAVPIQ